MAETPPWRWLWPLLMAVTGLVILLFLLPGGPEDWLAFLLNPETRPEIFILMMILLPIVGFPITPFLVLVGIKFGPGRAAGITAAIFSFHLIVCYLLTHSLLRRQVSRLLGRMNYRLPEIHQRRRLLFSIIFMALPGLPYTVKNFTLATLKVPFPTYFPVALSCNFILALPFIGLGSSLLEDPKIAVLILAILGGGYALALRLKRKLAAED